MDPVQSTPAIQETFDVFKSPVGKIFFDEEKAQKICILERKFNGASETIKNAEAGSGASEASGSSTPKCPSSSSGSYLVPKQLPLNEDQEVEMIMSKSLDSSTKLESATTLSKRSKSEPTLLVCLKPLPKVTATQDHPSVKEKRRLFIEEIISEKNMELSEPPSKLKMILIWLSVIVLIFAISVGLYFYS